MSLVDKFNRDMMEYYKKLITLAKRALLGINFLSRRLGYQVNIKKINVPGEYIGSKKIFKGCSLNWDERGFWFVDPMPNKEELDAFYSNGYWNLRVKNQGVNEIDIIHLVMLTDLLPNFLEEKKHFLNFGSGHGGISYLFWAAGHDVINVEPSNNSINFDERWKVVNDISEVDANSIDLVYGSHSLEHVHSIDKFHKILKTIIKDDGFVFWEVPNGRWPDSGPLKGKIVIPHTYYFTRDYFNITFSKLLLNSTFNFELYTTNICDWTSQMVTESGSEGRVIRVLAQL